MAAEPKAPKVKDDGSERFLLKGGRHDAHRNKKKASGFHLRVFPNYQRWDKTLTTIAGGKQQQGAFTPITFADEVTYDGDVYGFPAEQNPSDPFLVFLRPTSTEAVASAAQ